MYDVIIVGGGPAGATAGIYSARKNLKTLLITKDFVGQTGLTGIIENWPGEKEITGPELMSKFEKHLRSYSIDIKEEKVLSLEKGFKIKTESEEYLSRSVIIVSGRKSRELGVPGEKDFIGKGVVYCTTCDAPLFKGKRVIVVGGGNAGFESAIELTDHAAEVLLFEVSPVITADEILQKKAKEKGVKVFKEREIKELRGSTFLEEVDYEESGKIETVKADGLFVQIGSLPISDIARGLVEFNESGEIITNARCETKTRGLFAAGDVTDVPYKQIVIAAGEGAKAALSMYDYLKDA